MIRVSDAADRADWTMASSISTQARLDEIHGDTLGGGHVMVSRGVAQVVCWRRRAPPHPPHPPASPPDRQIPTAARSHYGSHYGCHSPSGESESESGKPNNNTPLTMSSSCL
jgi:hypothetical protein